MSDNLGKIMKHAITVKAAMSPIHNWSRIYQSTAIDAIRKNKFLSAAAVLPSMFRSDYFNPFSTYNEVVLSKAMKGVLPFNSTLLDVTNTIFTNQQHISSAIAKSIRLFDAYDRVPSLNFEAFGLTSFLKTAFPHEYTNRLISLDSALKSLSAQITYRENIQQNAIFLERFSETTERAVAITTELTEKHYATKEDIRNLEIFIEETIEAFSRNINEKIDKTAKSSFAKLNLWVGIISTLLTLFTIYQSLQPQDRPQEQIVSKDDIQGLITTIDERFRNALDEAGLKAKARISCHLRYKPNAKSKCLLCVQAGESVHIIESNHKWVRIAVIDPSDNLPITGWVLRKHLIRE